MAQPNDLRTTESDSKSPAEAMANSAGLDADKESAADLAAAGYGTRSRNRSGNNRPNYAEDKDIEMDVYDYYDKKDADGAKKSSRLAAGQNDAAPRSAAAARKAAALADDTNPAPSQGANANGTTNAQASQASAAQPSRKRKAAAAAAAQNSLTTASTRRGGTSTPQSSTTSWPETNMLTFENCKSRPQNGRMVADDGTVLEANDHVYLVCEPPGEPYYLGRIMEFLHNQNDTSRPVDAVRINWYYRPKDIGRKSPDTRLLFATMHSDISPLAALRGKCQIRHRDEIKNLDEYRKTPDSFWFEKLYDRYIQKNYDVVLVEQIVNVPDNVKTVLNERWKYVLIEQGRTKEMTAAAKACKRCSIYAPNNESVDCAVCKNTYHMNCIRPPLLKKPSRGFAWSCAACSRAQERKLEARDAPNGADGHIDPDDDDGLDDDDDDHLDLTNRTTPADGDVAHHQGTAEQIYHASLWPYRYLGIHCKPEDALDYDDRIYPRAGTRIGPRNQAQVHPWPGQPVQYVKPLENRRGKKGFGVSKEAQAAQETEKGQRGKRPKWVQDQPPGYTARGEDHDADDPNCTAIPLWIPPADDKETLPEKVEEYMTNARDMAPSLDLPTQCTNLQDVAINDLYRKDYDAADALKALAKTPMADFKEPRPTTAENKKFDEAITKYGNELGVVARHVKTMTPGQVVRYYYTWKKTDRGKQIWGNQAGRKGKRQQGKRAEAAASKVADDVADNDDDSAFDSNKASEKKRSFICQFCNTTSSRQWRRAPNSSQGLVDENGVVKPANKDKSNQVVVALCRRCAELWRRYGIRWEDIDEVAKKVAQSGKAWKRKQDEELLKELQVAQELGLMTPDRDATPLSNVSLANGLEPPRKKLKGALDKEVDTDVVTKRKDKTAESTPVPEMPKPRTLPCAICGEMEPLGDQHVSCRECRLTVHRNCYGVLDKRVQGRWMCDMCTNDKNPQVSVHYKCVLCPVEHTEHEFVDQPKLTHHKKKMSDKDRERERLEVQQARKAAEFYKKRQEELNRPVNPREPLKRTADNNWVHVTCAVWTPEIKFGSAKALEPCEGIASIPRAKYDEVCQACNQTGGACVPCHQCRVPFHIECARQQGHLLGFDVTPIKSSRRDQFNIVTINGESGTMSAMLWCKDHVPSKTIAHRMHEVVDESGLNALQLYVQNFKQADMTLTGTVRKASLMANSARVGSVAVQATASRASTTAINGAPAAAPNGEHDKAASNAQEPGDKVCISCGIDVTPRWWPIAMSQERQLTNGHYGAIGLEAQKFVEQRKFQCHKCRKLARTPRPHSNMPPILGPEPSRQTSQPRSLPPATMPSLRSPPPPPPPVVDYRDSRTNSHPWPRPPSSHHHGPGMPLGGPPPPHPVQAPPQPHMTASRPPPPPSQAYPIPPPRGPSSYGDWGHHRARSPPRHLNGGPPPLHSAPPPISSLRPPPLSGPPPPVGMTGGHQHSSPAPMYSNGLPPSPRRHGGPAPPSPYMPPYHGSVSHGGHPPPRGSPHSMANGVGPPPPPPPRSDLFAHGLHPQRSQYPPHGSPPMARNGLPPPPRDPPPPPRGPDGRPTSGASSSPSLRNLLS